MSDPIWMCPICGKALVPEGKCLRCENNHCFDKARSGYVHLLPSSRQHA